MSETSPRPLPIVRGGQPLSPQQAAIVDHVASHPLTVVDAGAGSGKTHTTVASVLHLLETRPDLSVDRFVLITFTQGAAAELRHGLETALVKQQGAAASPAARARWSDARECLANAYLGTIHGFCNELLRAYGYGAQVARELDIVFSRGVAHEAIEDAVEEAIAGASDDALFAELGARWQRYELVRIVRDILTDTRNRGLEPRDIEQRTAAQPDDPGKPVRLRLARLVAQANTLYSARKRADQLVDAADLLEKTAQVLHSADAATILTRVGARYRYLFVDEFQDTDRVQMRIVDALRPHLDAVLLVGDDKQSIYGFRGAGLRLSEMAAARGTAALPLNLSRRPTRRLLHLQNALFTSIAPRYPALRNLLDAPPEAPEGCSPFPAMVYHPAGDREEMELGVRATAAEIREVLSAQLDHGNALRRAALGDIAVLFRSNRTLDYYAAKLPEFLGDAVPVRKEAGGQFFRRPEVIGCYRMLRLMTDSQSDVVLAQALATPYLHLDAGPMIADHLRSGPADTHEITDWFNEEHAEHAQKLRDLRAASRSDTVPELLERLYEAFDMREYHRARGEARAVANLERLREMARDLTPSHQALTAAMWVRWLQVQLLAGADEPDALETDEQSRRPPYVRLMTIHKAKGSEFPVVIIPEVQARIVGFTGELDFVVDEQFGLDVKLPLSTPTASPRFRELTHRDDDDVRGESIRVFYVAVTRAQDAVIFVGSGTRGKPLEPGNPKYSWKDEIHRAWPQLQAAGAVKRMPPA